MPSDDMDAFKKTLQSSKRVICLAGAGLSAASGIPTFRGDGGMWRKYDAMSLATPSAFRSNPSRVWQFYHYRREKALTAQPNAAHYALAMFSIPHFRNSVMSSPDTTFSLVTQNVDELSRKALREIHSKYKEQIGNPSQPEPPPRELLEIHGSLFKLSCTECKHVEKNYNSPICPSLKGTEDVYEKASSKPEPDIPIDELPQCKACGALGRPGVVWFGEAAPSVILMNIIARESDFCLVVGTSSKVYPAAGVAEKVKAAGGKVAVFNIDRSEGDEDADFLFLGPCEETLPIALGLGLPESQ
ncbi:hypothetical protein QCA50_011208 [Cerrena zonata]|uniref:NAD-dependent protein deacylase n=1 Tax=Cerrena zonata TaxID=2478898 RepID=A0AAW0G898_9APHY